MKKDRRNLFQDVVSDENHMTELLCNFLQFKCFRDEFLKLFIDDYKVVSSVDEMDIRTQRKIESGRPDICIDSDQVIVYGEVKVENTGLTPNQPDGYLKQLLKCKHKHKWLIFVVPHNYRYISDIKSKFNIFYRENRRCTARVKIIYWHEIIRCIDSKELVAISSYMKEFRNYLSKRFEYRILVFTKEEYNMIIDREVPKSIMKLMGIVDYVKHHNSKYKSKIYTNNEEYTIYFKDKDNNSVLYFGVWYLFWEKHGTPLSYGIDLAHWDKKIIDAFTNLMHGQYDDEQGWRAAGIDPKLLLEESGRERIAEDIGGIVKQLLGK